MHLPFKSYVTPIFLPFSGTDLKRTYNGPETDLLLWHKNTIGELFFRIKRQTYTRGQK